MKLRIYVVVGLVFLSAGTVLLVFFPASEAQVRKSLEPREIPVIFKPIKVGGVLVPVEIQCDPVFILKPDTLESFSCVLVNNTNKSIRASGVLYTLISDSFGEPGRSSRIDVVDRFIHPDLFETKKPLRPGERQPVMAPGAMSERDVVIQSLEFEPVFLEFSDGTSVGVNDDSTRLIKQLRDGAVRFKDMARQEYFRNGKSVSAILPSLQVTITSENQSSWTIQERQGANAYRSFLLDYTLNRGSLGLSTIFEGGLQ